MNSVSPRAAAPAQIDARMVRTRAALLDAMLVLLEREAFEDITIGDITRQARVGYATFFRHYAGKDVLLNELASDQIRALLDLTLPVLHEADSRASCILLCRYVDEHRALWTALLTGGAASIMRRAFLREAALIPAHPSEKQGWIPEELRLVHGTTATIEVLAWWLRHGEHLSVTEIGEILNRLVIAPTIASVG